MKKMFLPLAMVALALAASSCTKCYVCKDKDSDTFVKTEVCDKDYDKGDIDAIIESYEAQGMQCHPKSRVF